MEVPSRNALVAVYRDGSTAESVADEVRGCSTSAVVRVDDPHDRGDSLRAEMREEIEHTLLQPQAGFIFPKESVKSLAVLVPIGAVLGAAVTVPITWLAFTDRTFGVGLVWALIIGATMGGTIAYIVGAAMVIGGPASQSAGHVGVPVRVEGAFSEQVLRTLASHEPIRIDLVTNEGKPVGTIMTEEDLNDDGIFQRLAQQFTQDPGGNWWSTKPEVLPELQARNSEIQAALNEADDPLADGSITDSGQTSVKDGHHDADTA